MKASSQMGATMAFSWMSSWIRRRIVSRFFGSISLACSLISQELPSLHEGIDRARRLPLVLESLREHAPSDLREAERRGLVDVRPVDRIVHGEPHPLVAPGRPGVRPLLGEDEPEGARRIAGLERQPAGAP